MSNDVVVMSTSQGTTQSLLCAKMLGIERKKPWDMPDDVYAAVNWGCGSMPPGLESVNPYRPFTWVNNPVAVNRSADKRACLHYVKNAGLPTVPFTTSHKLARTWWEKGRTVYCRVLSSSSGAKGLVVANKERGVPLKRSRLYTRFIKPTHEIRLFVSRYTNDTLMLIKKRRSKEGLAEMGLEKANFWVRNMDNGWVFLLPNEAEQDWAQDVVPYGYKYLNALGLDFAAIDMGVRLYEEEDYTTVDKAWLIESNTAPGLKRDETKQWFMNMVAASGVMG